MLLKEEGDMYYGKTSLEEGFFPKFCVDVLFPLPCENEEVRYHDAILVNKALDSEAMRGTVEKNGMYGELPTSCVEPVDQSNDLPPGGYNTVSALYTYEGDAASGDINFKVCRFFPILISLPSPSQMTDDLFFVQTGDEIEVLFEVSPDWLHGKCKGQVGNFPATFVDSIPPNLPKYQQNEAPPTLRQVTAVFDFQGSADDELTFKKGDEIAVTDEIDDCWWRGFVVDNTSSIGIFPKAYVGIVDVNENLGE